MCSGRVDPTFVLKALALGADGVMIAGCHPGDCHYIEQNYKAMRRYAMLKHTLAAMGVEPDRVRLVWASAAEGQQLAEAIDQAGGRRASGSARSTGRPTGRRTASGWRPWKRSSKNTKRRWRCPHERQSPKANWPSTGRPPAAAARSPSWRSTRRSSTWPRPSTSSLALRRRRQGPRRGEDARRQHRRLPVQRRHPHQRAGVHGPTAAPQVEGPGGLRLLRQRGLHPRAGQHEQPPGRSSTRSTRKARRPRRRTRRTSARSRRPRCPRARCTCRSSTTR